MSKTRHLLPGLGFVAAVLWVVPVPLRAAAGATSGGGSTCTVTVFTTLEDGSTDNSVRPFSAPCRSGQGNGDIEYYNPYTDSYETRRDPRIEPLVIKKSSSSSTRTGTATSRSGSRSTTGSPTSQSQAGSSGAPCTSSGTSSKAIKTSRSTSSGRPCSSTPR